ncbi:MAG TPA: hypothetical protein DCP51_08280 [Clostridiales bacterium]|nr:hypothetical protein [Clostridiales bacterium]
MSCNEKCGFSACSCLGVVISLIFGTLVAVLFALNLIPLINTVVWIVFGLAVLILLLLVLGVFLGAVTLSGALRKCLCKNALCLLTGVIGTIISAIVALSIVLNPALILVVIFTGILAFFFALMTIGLIAFIKCIICMLCSRLMNDSD